MRVELHIERLVLEGVRPGDRHQVAGALERELGRLVAERGLPGGWSGGREIARLDGGRLEAGPGKGPAQTGRGIARAVYRGFGS